MQLEEVKTFLEYIKRKGIVAQNTANSWSGAIAGVSAVLDGEEENTVNFVLENGDLIRNRLQNQSTNVSGATIGLYIQRSQLALRNFLEWKDDRAAWEKKQASKVRPEKNEPKQKKDSSQKNNQTHAEENKTSSSQFSNSKRVLPIPAGNGETFDIALPQNYRVDDLVRVMWGLAIYAEDFDPKTVLDRFGKPPAQPYQHREAEIVPARLS